MRPAAIPAADLAGSFKQKFKIFRNISQIGLFQLLSARTPPVEELLSHVGTPLEFPQIFM
jgi:hypothetical protein